MNLKPFQKLKSSLMLIVLGFLKFTSGIR